MAIKKSEIYRSLWASCDALRGGMDASQYKDYVLSLLFIKYISDKYAGEPYAPITVPDGASFIDMVSLKGKPDIGDQINKKIVAPLASSNQQLSQADFPDFNDSVKLGDGKEKVDRLTNLIAVFESPSLDFKGNRADGDDILGDAYEYLMRHFATESGKSKGQFYTPAEVSRIMAQILGIKDASTSSQTTVYDPTCGSGSLLLKVGDQAGTSVTLYGQEKDAATSGLARMNMILHDYPTAEIRQGNSLADPKFLDGEALKNFDYVVANPPFSDKRWTTGMEPANDQFERFKAFGTPPEKNGDYAYLLHIVRSLKSTGKGACILPLGALGRGNAESNIREKLVCKGYIQGVIGLPANLFYGTPIPACIVVIDKQGAADRAGIFMINANEGLIKDGPKNRLRSQDIHRIVDTFWRGGDVPGYARMVPFSDIEKNEFNLNVARYIDKQTEEDRHDIEGHLHGGIPAADIDALQSYWEVYPTMKQDLLSECRPGYFELKVDNGEVRPAIFEHSEFVSFREGMRTHYEKWLARTASYLKGLDAECDPKQVIFDISEDLLAHYTGKPLVDKYDIYQHLMDYWAEVMQDDCYLLAADGWKAETYRIIEEGKNGKQRDKGWACDLVPKEYLVARFFADEQAEIDALTAELETVEAKKAVLEEENGSEGGAFAELEKINKGNINTRLKETKGDADAAEEEAALKAWLKLSNRESDLKKQIKEAEAALDKAAYGKYPELTVEEIKALAVDDKWLNAVQGMIQDEMDRISHLLAGRIIALADRYEFSLPEIVSRVSKERSKVKQHLARMGFLCEGGDVAGSIEESSMVSANMQPWEEVPILDLVSLPTGQVDPRRQPYKSMPLIGPEHIEEGTGKLFQTTTAADQGAISGKYLVSKGDVIYGKINPHLRKVAIAPYDAICSADLYPLRPKEGVSSAFIAATLLSDEFSNFAIALSARSGIPKINREELAGYLVRIPVSRDEHWRIGQVMLDGDAEADALEALLRKSQQIKLGMVQELLSGRVRLV